MVEGVSCTYCDQCHFWTTGAKEHITTANIFRSVPLGNPRGANPPAAPTESLDPPAGVIAQSGTTNNTAGGVNMKASMEEYLVGDLDIGGDLVYD